MGVLVACSPSTTPHPTLKGLPYPPSKTQSQTPETWSLSLLSLVPWVAFLLPWARRTETWKIPYLCKREGRF